MLRRLVQVSKRSSDTPGRTLPCVCPMCWLAVFLHLDRTYLTSCRNRHQTVLSFKADTHVYRKPTLDDNTCSTTSRNTGWCMEAFFDAADDLADMQSEAGEALLASKTPHHASYKRWMDENDDGYRNSAQAKLDEYEAALSALAGSSKGPGKTSDVDRFIDSDDMMIPRVLAILQSTQNLVAEARLQGHRTISHAISDTTTVGISYTDLRDHATGFRDFIVDHLLIGGPAFHSKLCPPSSGEGKQIAERRETNQGRQSSVDRSILEQRIFPGDRIMAIDKTQIDRSDSKFDLQKELMGKNIPGSKVTLTLRRLSGKLDDVVLERIPTSQIADKRQMFDHFIRLQDRARKQNDLEQVHVVEEALEFWTYMMQEAHDYDEACHLSFHGLQVEVHKSLKDCQRILEMKAKCKQCDVLQKKVDELSGEHEALTRELVGARRMNRDLDEQLRKCTTALDGAEKQADRFVRDLEEIKRLYTRAARSVEQLTEQNESLLSRSASSDAVNEGKDREIQRLSRTVSGLEQELQQSLDQCQRSLQALQAKGSELQSRDAELRAQELRRLAYLKRRAVGMWTNREKAKAISKWWGSVLVARKAIRATGIWLNRALYRFWNSWRRMVEERREEKVALELEELRKQSSMDSLEIDILKQKPSVSQEALLELEDLKRRAISLEQELSDAAEKNKRIVDQTDTQIEAKSTEIAVLNVNIKRKDSDIESLKKHLLSLEKELSERPIYNEDMKTTNVELEQKLSVALQAEARMNDMMQQLKGQLDDLTKHADDLEDEKRSLNQTLAKLQEQHQKSQENVAIKQSSINSLESARSSLLAEKSSLVQQNDDLASHLRKLETQLDDAVRSKAELEVKLKETQSLGDKVKELQVKVDKCESSHERELVHLRMQNESQLSQMKHLNAEVDLCRKTHPEEIQTLTDEIQRLTNELSTAHGEIMELKEAILEDEKKDENKELVRCGVGMQVELNSDGFIHVLYINPGGAAFSSGKIIVGDIIHKVDGKAMRTCDDIFEAILGWEGTKVVLEIETTTGWRGDIELIRKVSPLMMSIGAVQVEAPELDDHHKSQPVETRSWNNVPEAERRNRPVQGHQMRRESERRASASLMHSISMPGEVGAMSTQTLGSAGSGRTRGPLGLQDQRARDESGRRTRVQRGGTVLGDMFN